MLFPDLGKWVFLYILDRLKVFSNINPEKLKVSIWKTSHLSLENVDLETESLAVSGLRVRSATVRAIDMELSTSGIVVKANGADIVVKLGNTHTDLVFSAFFDQTAGDLARSVAELAGGADAADLSEFADVPSKEDAEVGYGIGDTSGMVARLANAILAQIKVDIADINVRVLVGEEALIHLSIAQLSVPRGGHIEISGVTFEQLRAFPAASSSSSVDEDAPPASAGRGSVRFDVAPSDASESSDEEYGAMSQSMYFDSNSQFGALARTEAALAAVEEEPVTPQLCFIDKILVEHSIPMDSVAVRVPTVSLALLPILETAVEAINALGGFEASDEPQGKRVEFSLQFDEISICESDVSARCMRLLDLKITPREIVLERVDMPGTHIESPVLKIKLEREILVSVPNAVSVNIPLVALQSISEAFERIAGLILSIEATEPPEASVFSVAMAELKVSVGGLNLMIFPGPIDHRGLVLDEVTVTSDGGSRILVKSLQVTYDGLVTTIESLQADTNLELVTEIQAIADAVSRKPSTPIIPPSHSVPEFNLRVATIKTSYDSYIYEAQNGLVAQHQTRDSWSIDTSLRCRGDGFTFVSDLKVVSHAGTWKATFSGLKGDWYPAELLEAPPRQTATESVAAPAPGPSTLRYELKVTGEVNVHGPDTFQLTFGAQGTGNDQQLKLVSLSRLYMVDPHDEALVPLGSIENAHVTIYWSPFAAKVLVDQVSLALCADSCAALTKTAAFLRPPAPPPLFNMDSGQDSFDIFEDIEDDAFQYQSFEPSVSESAMPESLLDQDLDQLAEMFTASVIEPLDVSLIDDYMTSREPEPGAAAGHGVIELKIKNLSLRLHDGYDLKATRHELREAVERVKQEAEAILDSEMSDEYVGDFLYNSIYIGTKSRFMDDLEEKVDEEIGSPELGRGEKAKVALSVTDAELVVQPPKNHDGVAVSTSRLTVQDLVVWDNVPTSTWDTLLSIDVKRQREQRVPILDLTVETTLTDAPEQRYKVRVQPLRLTVDQDTLDFLTRFMQFQPAAEEPRPSATQPAPAPVFIQRFELSDLPLVVSYQPKKINYEGLRSGHTMEFMNLFIIRNSSAVLRHIVVYGQPGFDRLAQRLVENWVPDIANSQLADVLGGFGFLNPVIKIGRTIRKMIIIPVRGYSKDGSALIGMHRGAARFARSTTQQVRRQVQKWWVEKGELESALEEPEAFDEMAVGDD